MVLGTVFTIKMVAYVGVAPVAAAFAGKVNRRAFLVTLDLLRAAVALLVGVVAGYLLSDQIMELVRAPITALAASRDASLNYDSITGAFDLKLRIALYAGVAVSLTPKEFELLGELASDPGAVLTREHLIDSVWDEHWWGSTKTLDVHMASLRKKLAPELIETVRGEGYRLP